MDTNELRDYILDYTMPEMLDIEMAKRNVVEHLSSQPIGHMEKSEILIKRACPTVFAEKGPIPPGFVSITPDLNYVKGEVIACEAIQLLHTSGALVASGPLIRGGRILLETDTTQVSFQATYSHGSSTPRICMSLYQPFIMNIASVQHFSVRTFGLPVEMSSFPVSIKHICTHELNDAYEKALMRSKLAYI